MNKLFVWAVRQLAPLWSSLGADPRAVALILAAKLRMDDRGSAAILGQRQKPQKGQEYLTYFFIALFGIFLMLALLIIEDLATGVGLGYSAWVCYVGLLLITEMSENLFDQRDLYLLLSRPINSLTLSLARYLHIGVFAAKFALCLGVPTFLFVLLTVGVWAALVYWLVGVVALVLIMTGTLAGYLVLLRRVPARRVKKIVGYFQIVATLIFFTAYQLPSLLDEADVLAGLDWVGRPAGFLFPGFWLGGLFKVLTLPTAASGWAYTQALLALLAAAGGGWFYLRQSRTYASRLLALRATGGGHQGRAAPGRTSGRPERAPVRDTLAGWLTADNQERVSFRFHWNVMTRDLTFKQRVYPGMVYLPVIAALSLFKDYWRGEGELTFGAGNVLLLLYFVMWIVVIPLAQTKVSESYRSSWVFEATANPYPGRIEYGQLMAVLGMFFLPTVLLLYPLVLFYFGAGYWPDIVLAMGGTILFSLVYNSVDRAHPFSRSKEDTKFQNLLPLFLVSLFSSALGFGHYLLRDLPYVVPAAAVLVWLTLLGWLSWLRRVNRRELNS